MDAWRLNPKIMINYGLRWDYYGVIGAENDAFSLFDFATATVNPLGVAGTPSSLYPKDWTNFAPRFSLADDLKGNGKLVLRAGAGVFYDGASQDYFVGAQDYNTNAGQAGPAFNYVGFASPYAYPFGDPCYNGGNPILSADCAVFGPSSNYVPQSAFTVDQNLRTPRYVSYNVNIESQLTSKVALQLGYVGSQGRHLFHFRDLNQVNNEGHDVTCANGTTITYSYTPADVGNQCFPYYNLGTTFIDTPLVYLNQVETSAISNYNSMQASLKMQNWHSLTSTLNYTWAHSIDTASDGVDFVPNAAQPDDSFNPHAERASSNFDVRQHVQWYWTYNLHNFHQAKWITNGWALDGLFNFATGQPYTVSYLFEGDYNGSNEYFGRPDIIGNPHSGGVGGVNLLNEAAFAAPCTWDSSTSACVPNTQHPGSEGRNAFNAPNYTNFDFSLTKTSHITEKMTMELRADFFNIFNHPNLCNPLMPGFGIDVFGSSHVVGNRLVSGLDPTVNGPQFMTTTATPDVGNGNPYLGGGGPRGAQLAAHFNF
jgi:hypothetical protein